MQAVRKINNNVALCLDSKNRELIAFGKGIGFPKIPYEITDLNTITMTFYRIDNQLYNLIEEIPEEVLEVSAYIVNKAEEVLDCSLNPNLVVTLADHINFAMVRVKKYKNIKMLFSYEIEKLYKRETEVARYAVGLIQKRLCITLPESEVTSIAMHFINGREEFVVENEEDDSEKLISKIADLIESDFSIKIDRGDFSYNRFSMHLRYYLERLKEKNQFKDNNVDLMKLMKENYPEVYKCALKIGSILSEKHKEEILEDEILYLMIHINRIIQTTVSK